MKPIVDVVSLGGTIAMKPDGLAPGAVPTLTADDLIAAVPQLRDIASIRAQTFRNIPSAHLTFDDIDALVAEIYRSAKSGSQGIVITQGTDTIEETAYALDLMLDIRIPVIITGAMRNPSRPGADGPSNLLGAVQVAASPAAADTGVLVVLNDEIHVARFVHKSHSSSTATFKSDPLGPIGWIIEDKVRILLKPHIIPPIKHKNTPEAVKIPIIKLGMGDDETMIVSAMASNVDGIIIEALGGGHVPVCIANALEKVCHRIPVVLTSRTGQGESLTSTYGFLGSETDLLKRGLISGGSLDGIRARMLLCILMRYCGPDHELIKREFSSRGSSEF